MFGNHIDPPPGDSERLGQDVVGVVGAAVAKSVRVDPVSEGVVQRLQALVVIHEAHTR